MQVERINNADALASLAHEWDRLSRGVPFRSHAWLTCWWRHYAVANLASRRQLLVLAVRDRDGALRGLAPWFIEESLTGGRVIQFLGNGEIFSDYLSLFADTGHEQAVSLAIADWLLTDFDGAWDALELTGVDGDDRTVTMFLDQLATHGNSICRRPDLNCWRIELPTTWEAYLKRLSKSHRKQLRRAERRMENSGSLELQTATHPTDVGRVLEILIELHQRRQHSLGRWGCFSSRQFADFHREVAPRMAATGQLRLDCVLLDGRPIAAEYQLVGSDVVYAYQAGVEPEHLDQEPGRLAMLCGVRRAVTAGYRAYDFLRGDELYKAHWRAKPRPTLRARVVARHCTAQMRNTLWLARDVAKTWIKDSLREHSHG